MTLSISRSYLKTLSLELDLKKCLALLRANFKMLESCTTPVRTGRQ